MKVLITDDSSLARKLLLKALPESLTDEVSQAANGEEALAAYEAGQAELMFLDLTMPVMDGFESARAIRASEKGRRRTTIIAVTAGAMEGDKAECLAAGMDDVLAKPFSKNDLIDMMQLWVGRKL
jgi:CheY-like chemotaxis protein